MSGKCSRVAFRLYPRSSVVSAVSAVVYAQSLFPAIPLQPVAIALLLLFALLYIWGINDSANVRDRFVILQLLAVPHDCTHGRVCAVSL
jgi:hypothetical protein